LCKQCNTTIPYYVDAFGGPKAPQWGGMIQVAPEKLRIQKWLWKSSKINVIGLK